MTGVINLYSLLRVIYVVPVSIDRCWRGPIMPGGKRDIVLSYWPRLPGKLIDQVSAAVEISDIRVWVPPTDEKPGEDM